MFALSTNNYRFGKSCAKDLSQGETEECLTQIDAYARLKENYAYAFLKRSRSALVNLKLPLEC